MARLTRAGARALLSIYFLFPEYSYKSNVSHDKFLALKFNISLSLSLSLSKLNAMSRTDRPFYEVARKIVRGIFRYPSTSVSRYPVFVLVHCIIFLGESQTG